MRVPKSTCFQVTAALITMRDCLFIAQRPPNKKFGLCWEFPGGKLDPHESLQHCLQREIREELNWEVEVGDLFEHVRHEQDDLQIDLFAFWTQIRGGTLVLREHIACDWVAIPALHSYDFTEADRMLIERLEQLSALPTPTLPRILDPPEPSGCYNSEGNSPCPACSPRHLLD
jgi:8-oxo-dGTP diphosphatase